MRITNAEQTNKLETKVLQSVALDRESSHTGRKKRVGTSDDSYIPPSSGSLINHTWHLYVGILTIFTYTHLIVYWKVWIGNRCCGSRSTVNFQWPTHWRLLAERRRRICLKRWIFFLHMLDRGAEMK
ncbi:hypothetical protein HYPSUDRAFT_553793 [Hypholoma sublateritium FD-334 SS-4]|uniref:Uncharacterized protein n=1 Tax=Hypholoma sublateritium (strain FD-334 SS-4) TaxID=945553 RepID=A0A0D2LA43_HYPSF|nr:hypothetical protein HYPSUDRAFT_553793 [Hypholoma sublateritium FD-334 SS-4]